MANKRKSVSFIILLVILLAVLGTLLLSKTKKLSKEFQISEARNIASNFTSFSATNYTQRKANSRHGIAIRNCTDVANNTLPSNYQIADQKIASDEVVMCKLTGPDLTEISFSVIGIH